MKSGPRHSAGQLVVTSRKVRFIALQHGAEIALGKVMSALDVDTHLLALEATSNSLSGDYLVADAPWAAAVIETAVQMDRRILLPGVGSSATRAIPQHIKTEVWQRDGGRCVQCQATDYLEYDHVIPWSKGGASSVANVQVLCRRCNLAKSDRI